METENNQNQSNQSNQELPKKIKSTFQNIIQAMLNSYQIKTEATSNIIAKLNEFSMKYMIEVVEEAKLFAEYAKRPNITAEDVNLVFKKNSEKYQKIPQNLLEELAKSRNKLKLNTTLEPGMKLPNKESLLIKTCKNLVIDDRRPRPAQSMSEDSKDDIDHEFKNNGNMNGNDGEDSKMESISEELGNEGMIPSEDVKSEQDSDDLNEPSLKKKIKK